MKYNPYNLLRRTFLVAVAALSVAALPNAAFAGSLTKSDGTSVCTSFDSISLGPSGLVVNNCSSTTTTSPSPGAAGTFTVSAVAALPYNVTSTNAATITRTGGTTGAVTVTFNRGGGCGPAPLVGDSVTLNDGVTSAYATMRTPNNDAVCTITLTGVTLASGSPTSAPALGTSTSASINITSTASTPPPPTTNPPPPGTGQFNCPTIPSDAKSGLSLTWGGGVNSFMFLNSGQIAYTTLPTFASWGSSPQAESAYVSGYLTTGSPTSGTVEISISHCPGVIDTTGQYAQGTTGGKCYTQYPIDQSIHQLVWFEAVGTGGASVTDTWANTYGICEAYASNGPWYVNTRYNFTDGGTKDMAWTINWSYYNP